MKLVSACCRRSEELQDEEEFIFYEKMCEVFVLEMMEWEGEE